MKKKKYKKYEFGTAQASAVGAADQLIQPFLDPSLTADQFGYSKGMVGKSTGSGALKGAAIGANPALAAATGGLSIAAGALIGGTVGYIKGKKAKDKAVEAENEYNQSMNNARNMYSTNQLMGYDTQGEGEDQSLYAYGGQLKKLSNGTSLVQGRTHEQGGVKFPELGVELEDNETVTKDSFVFSDHLGFADKHKKIAKQIGNLEKRPKSREVVNTLNLLKGKEENLKVEQESLKDIMGIDNDGNYKLGGSLKKYELGGEPKPPVLKPSETSLLQTVQGINPKNPNNKVIKGTINARTVGQGVVPGIVSDFSGERRTTLDNLNYKPVGDSIVTGDNLLSVLGSKPAVLPGMTKAANSLPSDVIGGKFTKYMDDEDNLRLVYDYPFMERSVEQQAKPTRTHFYASENPLTANKVMKKYLKKK